MADEAKELRPMFQMDSKSTFEKDYRLKQEPDDVVETEESESTDPKDLSVLGPVVDSGSPIQLTLETTASAVKDSTLVKEIETGSLTSSPETSTGSPTQLAKL